MPTVDEEVTLTAKLRNLANKIRGAWGQHPDADLADEAATRIEELEAQLADMKDEPAPVPTPTKKGTK